MQSGEAKAIKYFHYGTYMYQEIFLFSRTFGVVSRKNIQEVAAFGVHLRKLREQRGLSQQQLADEADVARKTIERIENAKFSATIDMLISIAKALKIPLRELVDF